MGILILLIAIIGILTILFVIFITIWNKLYENDIIKEIPDLIFNIYNSESFIDISVAIFVVCLISFIAFSLIYNCSKHQIAQYTEDEYDIEQIVSDYKKKNQSDPEKYKIEIKYNDQYKPIATLYEYSYKKDHYLLVVYNININVENDMDYSKYKRKD